MTFFGDKEYMKEEKPNEDIELARQSGYNEACFVYEEKVKKLKVDNSFKIDGEWWIIIKKTKIDKIMGSFNHAQDVEKALDGAFRSLHKSKKKGCGKVIDIKDGGRDIMFCGKKYDGKIRLCPKCEVSDE